MGSVVAKIDATYLRGTVSPSVLPRVLMANNYALQATFYLVTALAYPTVFGSATIEWISVKEGQQAQGSGAVGRGEAEQVGLR